MYQPAVFASGEDSVSPTVKNLKKVADVLGCTVDELIAGENNAGKGEE